MASITVRPLADDVSFGARISGVTEAVLQDGDVRRQINDVFEASGMIVFEGVEPSGRMQLALSDVFGPLKPHPVAAVDRVDDDTMPGVIQIKYDPEDTTLGLVEIEGKILAQWLPWHFDHCYNNELNRAGILRALEIPPSGGLTGFVDGVQLYNDFDPGLRQRIEEASVLYTLDMIFDHMRFGQPDNFREVRVNPDVYRALEQARAQPRAVHPAVWTRASGEKVLHVSPWMAVGIQHHEDPEGDVLLQEVCEEIGKKAKAYFHHWKPDDMLIWDNWRLLHCVSGHDPKLPRCMHRTTIKGDYGLGSFEDDRTGSAILETTV